MPSIIHDHMKEALLEENGVKSFEGEISNVTQVSSWLILRLCIVGFLVNCQPSEPFLTRYLIKNKKLSEGELDDLVWPVDTYASLLFLFFMGFLAEMVSYRAVIALGIGCRQLTRLLLLFSTGLLPMQLMQATYAGATAAEAVYFAYPYVVVNPDQFLLATVAVRATAHIGNAIGSGIGQILVSTCHVELRTLFFLSWGFTTLGMISFAVLPYPKKNNAIIVAPLASEWLVKGPSAVLFNLKVVYQVASSQTGAWILCSPLALWSMWWVLGTATSQVFINYQQNMVYASDTHAPFGLIEVLMEVGAAVIICFPLWSVTSHLKSNTALTLISSSLLWAVVCVISLYGWGWPPPLWVTSAASVILSALLGLQQAIGSVSMATGATGKEESKEVEAPYAMVFTTASLLGLVIAAIGQWLAANAGAKTKSYMLLAVAHEAAVVPFVLLLLFIGWIKKQSYQPLFEVSSHSDSESQ